VSTLAQKLWDCILAPKTTDFEPQIRGYHAIKWASLNRWSVPDTYTHIVVDECHNLSKSVLQMLSNGPQARITLGDDYQSLTGNLVVQSENIRQREMVHSVRSGRETEGILNKIILAHPSKIKTPFVGNGLNKTDIDYYVGSQIPEKPSMILVNDVWGLFEWSQRLASERIHINLLGNPKALDMFVQDCIELYSNGSVPRHGELYRFSSWSDVEQRHGSNPGFIRIDRMLEKRYSYKDWQHTYQRMLGSGSVAHSLALVENVRNLEFDTVMLTPGMFGDTKKTGRTAFFSSVYTSITRSRRRLILPEELRNWVDSLS